ncbi:MAG: hypothetical protein ABIG11_06200 [bacterium]
MSPIARKPRIPLFTLLVSAFFSGHSLMPAGTVAAAEPAAENAILQKTTAQKDPEIAELALEIQKSAVSTLVRVSQQVANRINDFKDIGRWLKKNGGKLQKEILAKTFLDTDVVGTYELTLREMAHRPPDEISSLIAAVFRRGNFPRGPPLEELHPAFADGPFITIGDGPGADIIRAIEGPSSMPDAVEYANRHSGQPPRFVLEKGWGLDFYRGAFSDVTPLYRKEGYSRFYRIKAVSASLGWNLYVLSGHQTSPPRIVLAEFYGNSLFDNLRAQFAFLASGRKLREGQVRTLNCDTCLWSQKGIPLLRDLLERTKSRPDILVMGYENTVFDALHPYHTGTFQNEYWRVHTFDIPSGHVFFLESGQTYYGEIASLAVGEFLKRGTRRVYFAGSAGAISRDARMNQLVFPNSFLDTEGSTVAAVNILAQDSGEHWLHQSVISPMFETIEWVRNAWRRKVNSVDCEAALLAKSVVDYNASHEDSVSLGIALIITDKPMHDTGKKLSLNTMNTEDYKGKSRAKNQYRKILLDSLGLR